MLVSYSNQNIEIPIKIASFHEFQSQSIQMQSKEITHQKCKSNKQEQNSKLQLHIHWFQRNASKNSKEKEQRINRNPIKIAPFHKNWPQDGEQKLTHAIQACISQTAKAIKKKATKHSFRGRASNKGGFFWCSGCVVGCRDLSKLSKAIKERSLREIEREKRFPRGQHQNGPAFVLLELEGPLFSMYVFIFEIFLNRPKKPTSKSDQIVILLTWHCFIGSLLFSIENVSQLMVKNLIKFSGHWSYLIELI